MSAVKVAAAALSIAVSTALQISGFGGPIAQLVAWSTVVLLAAFLLVRHVRQNRPSRADIGSRAWRLGHDLIDFISNRRATAPRRRTLAVVRVKSAQVYEADTMSLFRERFAEALLAVVQDLRETGLLGAVEAHDLSAPANSDAVERLGYRLVELGSQMGSAPRSG